MLVVVETHPIQYHAPVWAAASSLGVPIHVIYGCNFSTSGYYDKDFGSKVKWDDSLLEGYSHEFLPTNHRKTPSYNYESVTSYGLTQAITRLQPMSLLACGYTHPLDRACIFESVRKQLPLIYRGEANDSAKQRNALKRFSRDTFLRLIYSRVKAFLSIGTEAHNHYIRLGAKSHAIFSSPYAVNVAPFRTSEADRDELRIKTRRDLGIPLNAKIVLFAGKLSYRKGVDLLLTAISLIDPDSRPFLLLLGDGDLRIDLENSLLPVNVRVVGFQPQSKLSQYYHASDVLVLPSRHSETWGLVVNEALEHGLPVVVSNCVGSRHDLVLPGLSGETFERNNLAQLLVSLNTCLSYDNTPIARNRRKELVGRFSIESAAAGLHDAWSWIHSQ